MVSRLCGWRAFSAWFLFASNTLGDAQGWWLSGPSALLQPTTFNYTPDPEWNDLVFDF
jgi:hypothetical protein